MIRKLLLLYDTQEQDFARDLKEFFQGLGIQEVRLIPLEPGRGGTLGDKEKHYLEDSPDLILFHLTPRGQDRVPSPSVSEEMGLVRAKFSPDRVLYLVNENCKVGAINQKEQIRYKADDPRTIVQALARLVGELKKLGWGGPAGREESTSKLDGVFNSLSTNERDVLYRISHQDEGTIEESTLKQLLVERYGLNGQAINLFFRSMKSNKLLKWGVGTHCAYWQLDDQGWKVVELEIGKRKETRIKNKLSIEISKRRSEASS